MAVIYLTSQSQMDLMSVLVVLVGNQATTPYVNTLFGAATPEIPAGVDANGNPTPDVPAKGLPGYYYLSVNDPTITLDIDGNPVWPGTLPSTVTQDAVNGQAVLGVWA